MARVIVTVTPNPAVDVTYGLDALRPGQVHRVRTVTTRAGGKGVNVARVLVRLGSRCAAVGLGSGPDADAVVAEIRRVLRPDGVAYLGLGNKYMLMEPHYRLPLLSWLPQRLADAYVRRTGKADVYYEQHRSRSGLRRMLRGFHVYDYTLPVVRHPEVFGSGDQVPGAVARLPLPVLQALSGIVPTYVWLATKQVHPPARRDAADGLAHLDLTR